MEAFRMSGLRCGRTGVEEGRWCGGGWKYNTGFAGLAEGRAALVVDEEAARADPSCSS